MTRSITPWTIVLGAALMALPASGLAQTPPQQPPQQQTPPQQPPPSPAQPPATQPPATQPPTAQPPASDPAKAQPEQHAEHSAAEHLSKAKAALNEIEMTAVTGTARTRLTELKRHVAALDRAVAPGSQTGQASKAKPAARSWATDVAAIDRILTELTTPVTAAGDPTPATGTTGTTGTTGKDRTRAEAAVTVDDATRAKLLEVRTHITAFASAMSGTAPSAPDAAAPATSTPPDPTTPATPPSTTAPPTEPPTAQPPTTQPQTTPPTDPAAAAAPATVDKDAARRHLTEARDVLSQLTQLPEAVQLSGDARTQVSQLITNFNELITTQAEWRASFAKVQENLTALIGAERTDEANVTPPATSTPGAVGTSGLATLDPKIREKLVEFRTKLTAFERAAGGGQPK